MGFLSSLFGSSDPQSVLGVDIGSSSIKIVQLKRQGSRALLETYGELSLGPYAKTEIGRATNLPPEEIAHALKDVMRECKVTAKTCALAIPFSASLISVIEIPEVSEKELDTIVPIEARKYIPVPIAEVSLDWFVIPKPKEERNNPKPSSVKENSSVGVPSGFPSSVPGAATGANSPAYPGNFGGPSAPTAATSASSRGKLDVLTVAIHNDTIGKYNNILKQAELTAAFFEIEIFSAIRALIDNDPAPVMILDMGAASTKLYIVERGIIRNSHTINKGSQDITLSMSSALGVTIEEAELIKRGMVAPRVGQEAVMSQVIQSTLSYIFSEAQRVMLSYQKKYMKNLSRVYLVGGGVKLRGFLEDARKGLQIDVIPGDPFTKIQTPAFLENVLKVTGPEFTVAVGVALRRLQELN